MKLKVISSISMIALIINSKWLIYAHNNESDISRDTNGAIEKNLAKEVIIEGIEDNTIMYIGADLDIKANVDSESTITDIEWTLNKEGIINIISNSQEAKLIAISSGEVSVMARATDGSDVSRSINIHTEQYSNDKSNIKLTKGIKPIKLTGIDKKSFLVESDKLLSVDEQIICIENFLIQSSKIGYLSVIGSYSYTDKYEIYKVKIDGIDTILELRVDKLDIDYYMKVMDIIKNLDDYNNMNSKPNIEPEPPIEEPKPNIEPDPPIVDNTLENILPDQGLIVNKGDCSIDNPIELVVDEKLSIYENKQYIKAYMDKLSSMGDVSILGIGEDERYTIYKLKLTIVSNTRHISTKNDFYINIKVKNDDVESYKDIILMVDDDNSINPDNNVDENKDTNDNINNNDKDSDNKTFNSEGLNSEDIKGQDNIGNITLINANIHNKVDYIEKLSNKSIKNYENNRKQAAFKKDNVNNYNKDVIKTNDGKENLSESIKIPLNTINTDISRIGIVGISIIGIIKLTNIRKYI